MLSAVATITDPNNLNNTNCSLYIDNIHSQDITNNIVTKNSVGTNTTFTGTNTTDGKFLWKISCDNGIGGVTNSTNRNYTIDTVTPSIDWIYPDSNVTVSGLNLTGTRQINVTANDTNLYRVNFTVYYKNYTVFFNEFIDNLTGTSHSGGTWSNTSHRITQEMSFFTDNNYTLSMSVADSHTLGDLGGMTYNIEDNGIDFITPSGTNKKIFIGKYNDSTFYFF